MALGSKSKENATETVASLLQHKSCNMGAFLLRIK